MFNTILHFPSFPSRSTSWGCILVAGVSVSVTAMAAYAEQSPVVPGYVAPVAETSVAPYVDDTRGVYVPEHEQLRSKTPAELADWNNVMPAAGPLYTQGSSSKGYEQALNRMAGGPDDTNNELERIGSEPGLLEGGRSTLGSNSLDNVQMAQNTYGQRRTTPPASLSDYPSLATGRQAQDIGTGAAPQAMVQGDGGIELAIGGQSAGGPLDLQHAVVKLKEERITVRRALQRMLDQVGGSGWSVVWDLDEVNAGLPDMEISIYAEEPFVKVLNALLARLQTRSGQPLRVIKYDKTQRLVITDRTGGDARSSSIGVGQNDGSDVAVTESVLKEAKVSLHYDEVPLVDALENIVNQAGKGQWRLRMYAGTDQVLKPAHVEEPFGVAIERILKIFNLRYEVFPGGKLIVVTGNDRFGFRGIE